ncbi:MAG: transcriptional activator RfaH [Alphaproteobacteria bacterium]|nr:transcriptional activator RfaH [Alphaproteobacteria bacterium]
MNSDQRWFVVRTQPNGEFKALAHIMRQGFDAYLPRYLKRRRHARKTDTVQKPLFPGYLFVGMDPEHARWRALNSTIGVSELICHSGVPAPVPDQIIGDIRRHEDERGYVVLGERAGLKPGDKVRITDGTMADQVGIFDAPSDQHRAFLLLELLGRQVRVKMPLTALAPAN